MIGWLRDAPLAWLRWRSWRWRAGVLLGLVAAECAAVLTELDSKPDASGPLAGATGPAAYAAGWPINYAHIAYRRITFPAWRAALHTRPALGAINWFIFAFDVLWLSGILALGLGLVAGAWSLAARGRGRLGRTACVQSILLGIALAALWAISSTAIVSLINQQQPTDAATWHIITQPILFVALLPGALGFAVQRAFEGGGALGIAQTAGPATGVEVLAVLALTLALPAALLTLLVLAARRALAHRRAQATDAAAQEVSP
jgi:hypothetical protein